jgi:transposase
MEKEYNGLSDKQEMAIELVVCGMNDRDIAEQTGKSRQTINRWHNHDPDFRAVLAERRKETRERHRDELSGLVSEAIGVMREVMREGDMSTRLRSAQAVLRMSGLQMEMQTEIPLSKDEIISEFILESFGEVAQEMGLCDPKQLPSGE